MSEQVGLNDVGPRAINGFAAARSTLNRAQARLGSVPNRSLLSGNSHPSRALAFGRDVVGGEWMSQRGSTTYRLTTSSAVAPNNRVWVKFAP